MCACLCVGARAGRGFRAGDCVHRAVRGDGAGLLHRRLRRLHLHGPPARRGIPGTPQNALVTRAGCSEPSAHKAPASEGAWVQAPKLDFLRPRTSTRKKCKQTPVSLSVHTHKRSRILKMLGAVSRDRIRLCVSTNETKTSAYAHSLRGGRVRGGRRPTHAHARARASTHARARTHSHIHTRSRARTDTHTHTNNKNKSNSTRGRARAHARTHTHIRTAKTRTIPRTRARARKHASRHARTHARTHSHTHTLTHTQRTVSTYSYLYYLVTIQDQYTRYAGARAQTNARTEVQA